MRSGDLRHRIAIQTNTPVANSFNEMVDTWTTYATVWAEISPLTGTKYFADKQANSDVSGIVRIRYRSDIVPTMRLLFGTRVFQIVSIIHPKEKRDMVELYYKELLD
jgi:SPP1 family predicted phage head-tail adaptor